LSAEELFAFMDSDRTREELLESEEEVR